MIKTSFAVGYRKFCYNHLVLGVISIVPNMNGVLFVTEDGKNHFVESHDMQNGLNNMFIDYNQEECLEGYIDKLFDHRNK